MKLRFRLLNAWPKLAWLARGHDGDKVQVFHGPCVEVSEDWCVEGAWNGEFRLGDFDTTELFVGSGFRRRGERLVFVPSGNVLDRLFRLAAGPSWHVSNSLPALLAVSGARLVDGFDYANTVASITLGVDRYTREIPTSAGPIELHYFHNFGWDGDAWRRIPKPVTSPPFPTYSDYYSFLTDTAKAVGANSRSADRKHAVHSLVSVSSGYDSPAIAVLAKTAGCGEAVTLKTARSRLRHSDSGEPVANALGLRCTSYERDLARIKEETAMWAGMGIGMDLNLTLFDYPEPVCLLYTAFHGDRLWDIIPQDLSGPISRKDTSGARMGEFRLIAGVIECCPVFWGVERGLEIQKISKSEEMKPWSVGGDYDRPIPRRMVETAGVSREVFARRKLMTSFSPERTFPYSTELWDDFRGFAESKGQKVPTRWDVFSTEARNIVIASLRRLKVTGAKSAERILPQVPSHLAFCWANNRMAQRYQAALTGEVAVEP